MQNKEVILKVPYCSQIEEVKKNKMNSKLSASSCGLASLKMTVEYFTKKKVPFKTMLEKGLEEKAYIKDIGWSHDGLVRLAKVYGLKAWRRRYYLNKLDQEFFRKTGISKEGLKKSDIQIESEGIMSIARSILEKKPVIADVSKNFKKDGYGHLIVVTGVRGANFAMMEVEGFYINDPLSTSGKKENEFISIRKFKNWKRRAIFF